MSRIGKDNYLDYVPLHDEKNNTWDADENGMVTIHTEHKGIYNKIAQVFFHRPRISHIELDTYGSFIWLCIDGKRTVGDIAAMMSEKFGADAEPLYNRLVQYMKILNNNEFIKYRRADKTEKKSEKKEENE